MKRTIVIMLCLFVTFFGAWGVKAGTPENRPADYQDEETVPWYLQNSSAPVASDEWYIDPEIPLNYIPVPGEDELYMVVDDSGSIIGYRHRAQQADGSWVWEDVNPDIPDNYEPVPGLENVYKVTDADGNVSYFLYVRNDDDTFCFVPCDENGVPLDDGASTEVIGDNYVHVVDNTYALYNDDGVLTGYRERVLDEDGGYVWKVVDAPDVPDTVGGIVGWGSSGSGTSAASSGTSSYELPDYGSDEMVVVGSSGTPEGTSSSTGDGTYTTKETNVYTAEEDGYTVTYQETVYAVYSTDGTLQKTWKDGPYEVGRTASSTAVADQSQIASTLDAELARVSASVTYDTEKAAEMLASLNAERASQGLAQLSMSTTSDAYKVACIRAADMAIYDYGSSDSPMYGGLSDLCSRFGVTAPAPSELVMKTQVMSASSLHTSFQAGEDSRNVRMYSGYTEVGIAIVEKNGYMYVAEVYLGN